MLLGAVFAAAWFGVALGVSGSSLVRSGKAPSLSAGKFEPETTLGLHFRDLYTERDGPYYSDYSFVKDSKSELVAAYTKTTVTLTIDDPSLGQEFFWTVTDPAGTVTTATTSVTELEFEFSMAGLGSVSVKFTSDDVRRAPSAAAARRAVK